MTALDAEEPTRTSENDFLDSLAESAKAGDKTAKRLVEQSDSWREMPFVRVKNGSTMIEWPPVQITGEHEVMVSQAVSALGVNCALDLIGHLRNNGKTFDGSDLVSVARAIVERGEFTLLETSFFSVLGDFIAWGYARASADFDAVLIDDRKGARS